MRIVIGFVLVLAGCSGGTSDGNDLPPATQQNVTTAETSEIVGRWSLDGECDADLLIINSDGTWKGSVDSGRWELEGKNLVITGAPPSSNNGDQEESRSGEITSLTEDQMTINYNNEPEVWLRCD